MAKVFGKVVAGKEVTLDATTVQDVVNHLNLEGAYTATVDGNPAAMETVLEEGNFVVLAKSVKGGKRKIIVATDLIKIVRDGKDYYLNGVQTTRKEIKAATNAMLSALGYEAL